MPARVAGALDLATEATIGAGTGAGTGASLRMYVQRPAEKQWGCPTYETAQLTSMIITLASTLAAAAAARATSRPAGRKSAAHS